MLAINLKQWSPWILKSIAVHILTIYFLFLCQKFNFLWHHEPPLALKTIPIQIIRIASTTPAGLGSHETKAEQMNRGLNRLAVKMSTMTAQMGLSDFKVAAQQGNGNSALLNSLQNQLGHAKRTSLNEAMKLLSQGSAGDHMKWNLYGDKGNGGVSQKDLDRVSKIFRSLQREFRDCYENALLKDEALSVIVQYEAQIQDSGGLGEPSYSILGRSTTDGEKTLTGCLTNVLSQIRVGRSLSGIRIKNEFIFKT